MSTKKLNKVAMAQRVHDLVGGTLKHLPSGPLTVGGQSFTADSLILTLQSLENAFSKVDEAKAAWKDALSSLAHTKAKVDPTVRAYRGWVVATYGSAPAMLAEFGLTPSKARTPMTAEAKAIATVKRAATRAARHTAGPKQKAKVKGDVKVAVVTTPAQTTPANPPAASPTASPPPAKAT